MTNDEFKKLCLLKKHFSDTNISLPSAGEKCSNPIPVYSDTTKDIFTLSLDRHGITLTKQKLQELHKNDNTEQKCEPDYITAHEYSMFNRRLLEHDKRCGCFHCLKVFDTKELEWVDFDLTALCPYCGIDAVIGESAGYPLTEEFLEKMRDYWFSW